MLSLKRVAWRVANLARLAKYKNRRRWLLQEHAKRASDQPMSVLETKTLVDLILLTSGMKKGS